MFTYESKLMIGQWLIIHAENHQPSGRLFKNSNEECGLGRLPAKQRIDHDWRILIKTNEWYDPSWLSLKYTIDHERYLSQKQKERFEHGWLSMKQTIDHVRKLSMETNWMIRSRMISDETNKWSCRMYIPETKKKYDHGTYSIKTNDWPKGIYIYKPEKKDIIVIMDGCWLNKWLLNMVWNQGSNWSKCFWMLTDNKTTVRDGSLSKKPDERCDIVLFYVKQSIDTDGSIHIIAKKVFSRMIIDGTTNKSWWKFTQTNAMEDRTLFDYPCRKRPVMTNAF